MGKAILEACVPRIDLWRLGAVVELQNIMTLYEVIGLDNLSICLYYIICVYIEQKTC